MSRYVGSNEAASREARNGSAEGDLQSHYDDSVAPTQTLRSFTPINKGPVNRWVVNNVKRNRSRGLDSDMLFDLPDEPLSGLPAPKKRRQTSNTPARPKKTSSSIPAHPRPNVTERESSQLGTSPNSKKRLPKRSSAQTELFSSAGITKPILGPMKVITTEDSLKAKSVSLGQTTMEKLASFRFWPTAHYLPNFEAPGMAGSMKGIVEGPEMARELRHDTTYYEEDHYREFDDPDTTSLNDKDTYQAFDEATALDNDDDVTMLGSEEISISKRGATLILQPDSGDEFPVDDDLETELAQLSMPDKSYESLSPRLDVQSLRDEDLQNSDIDRVHFQPASPSSNTLVGDNSTVPNARSDSDSSVDSIHYQGTVPRPLNETINWPSVHEDHNRTKNGPFNPAGAIPPPKSLAQAISPAENDDYSPLKPFARPGFPSKVPNRSPITGISSNIILRTCFRIGEALREGAFCEGLGQYAVIELFARVMDSSQDILPSKLYFGFADLFHDRPPFIRGTLENNKISSLQETESRMLLRVNGSAPMVRCLGRLKRVIAVPPGWMLYIINIRPTDWEEVRWTRQIAGVGMMK